MKVEGRYEIVFDIIMDNGYKMSFDLLRKYFREYGTIMENTLSSTLYGNQGHITLDDPSYNYTPIFRYFSDKKYIIRVTHYDPKYRIMDRDKFIEEFKELTNLYLDIERNWNVYEREFLIDKVIDNIID